MVHHNVSKPSAGRYSEHICVHPWCIAMSRNRPPAGILNISVCIHCTSQCLNGESHDGPKMVPRWFHDATTHYLKMAPRWTPRLEHTSNHKHHWLTDNPCTIRRHPHGSNVHPLTTKALAPTCIITRHTARPQPFQHQQSNITCCSCCTPGGSNTASAQPRYVVRWLASTKQWWPV